MLEFWDFVYSCIFVLIIMIFREIIEHIFIKCRKTNIKKIDLENFNVGCPDTITNATQTSNCDRASWLYCDANFDSVIELVKNSDKIIAVVDKFDINKNHFDNSNIQIDLDDLSDKERDRLIYLAKSMRLGDNSFVNETYKAGHEDNRIFLDSSLYLGKIISGESKNFAKNVSYEIKENFDEHLDLVMDELDSYYPGSNPPIRHSNLDKNIGNDGDFRIDHHYRRHLYTYVNYGSNIHSMVDNKSQIPSNYNGEMKNMDNIILDPIHESLYGLSNTDDEVYGTQDIYIDARNVYFRTATTKIGTNSCRREGHDKLVVFVGSQNKPGTSGMNYKYYNNRHDFINFKARDTKC
jgi:hypothetical protein